MQKRLPREINYISAGTILNKPAMMEKASNEDTDTEYTIKT